MSHHLLNGFLHRQLGITSLLIKHSLEGPWSTSGQSAGGCPWNCEQVNWLSLGSKAGLACQWQPLKAVQGRGSIQCLGAAHEQMSVCATKDLGNRNWGWELKHWVSRCEIWAPDQEQWNRGSRNRRYCRKLASTMFKSKQAREWLLRWDLPNPKPRPPSQLANLFFFRKRLLSPGQQLFQQHD